MATANTKLLCLWLSISNIATDKLFSLLEIYSVAELFDRVKQDRKIAEFVGERQYATLLKNANVDFLEKAFDNLYKNDVKFLGIAEKEFPETLKQKQVSPRAGLYYRGNLKLLSDDANKVAIVGTRRSSSYGRDMAQKFAGELVDYGFTIVSGLATGIDAYSHDATLKAGGNTIAVLGMGHNRFYPSDNQKLFERICKEGLAVSEYPPTQSAAVYTFPERNRIISGLCSAVIIVEASTKSGALITASRATEQNREVFVIPGNINSSKSQGTNSLIKQGATMLTGTQDILQYFSVISTSSGKKQPTLSLDKYEQKVYNLLDEKGTLSFDEILEYSDFKIDELFTVLMSLEMKGAIGKQGLRYSLR